MGLGSRGTQPLQQQEFFTQVERRLVPGYRIMRAMGERSSIQVTVPGEDMWRGNELSSTPAAPASHIEIPVPDPAGIQVTFISESDADNGATATGVLAVMMEYLDADGGEHSEIVTMNGVTGADSVATDIRFVQDVYSVSVGSGGVAAGNIRVYNKSDNTLVYNMIHVGGNKSLVPNRMIPNGKTLLLKNWQATEAKDKRVAYRIRSTDMHGILLPGVFTFKDTSYLKNSASGAIELNDLIPALSIIKISGWADAVGAEGSCSWWGLLIDNGA